MATAIQRRRGTTSQHSSFTGLAGEITIDTDKNTVVVHDGSQAGGYPLAKYTDVSALGGADITDVVAGSGLTGGATSGSATISLNYENLAGNLVPSANNTYSLGTSSSVWKDVFVGPGSLYVNGQQVISDNSGTITIGADANQNISIVTAGSGDVEITTGGQIQLKSDVVLSAGKTISTAGGGATTQGGNINMDSNNINNLDDPVAAQDGATKAYVDAQILTKDNTDEITEGSSNLYYTNARADARITAALIDEDNMGSNSATRLPSQQSVKAYVDSSVAAKDALSELSGDSDDITEGTTNLFHTSARAQTEANVAIGNNTTTNLDEGTNLYFTNARADARVDAGFSAKDTDNLSEGTNSLYFTNERAQDAVGSIMTGSGNISVNYNDAGGVITISETLTTTDITEGDNQYHTSARARAAISVTDAGGDGSLAYNSGTGVITYTGPSASEVRAHLTAGDGLDVSSGEFAVDNTIVRTTGAQTIAGAKTFSNDAIFNGNLTINGTQTVVNTETLTVDDNIIILNNNASGTPTENAGIQVNRGTSADVTLRWGESTDTWEFTNDGSTYYALSTSTSDLAEGSNLYFTNARADARIAAANTDNLSEGSSNLYYTNARADARVDAGFSAKDTDNLSEGSSNLYYTDSRADARVAAATGANLSLANKDTDDLGEGSTNLYHTSARADARFDVKMAAAVTDDLDEGSSNLYYTDARAQAAITGGTAITVSSGAVSVTAGSIGATQLASTGVSAATYGDADSVAQFTVDADGRVTAASSVDIAISSDAVSGLATSATVDTTSASNISSGTLNSARLPDLAVSDFAGASIQLGTESFSDSDSVLMTAAAIQDKITSYGYTTTTGDITGVTAGSGLTGGGSSGGVTLNVGAGSYMTVNADDIAVDATSANTASKVVARDGSGNFSAGTITATATNAQYADLAEIYKGDSDIEPGTVVVFGGEFEITECEEDSSHAVAGVISTDPAHLMNAEAEGSPVALAGRVPCKVTGPVAKGDLMVSSSVPGHAKADNNASAGRIIGKAIEAKEGDDNGVIEVLVNMM